MFSRPKLLISSIVALLGFLTVGWYWLVPISEQNPPAVAISSAAIVKLHISEAGVYRIDPETLQKKGLMIDSWVPDSLGLTSMGHPTPFALDGNAIVFYGEPSSSIYANFRPYLLHLSADPTQRSLIQSETIPPTQNQSASAITKEILLEENNIYNSVAYEAAFPDTWYWETIHVQKTFEFSHILTDVADGSGRMVIHFFGQSHDPQVVGDHDLDLIINGQKVTTITWEGPIHYVADVELPPGTLHNGSNTFLFDNTPPGGAFIDIMGLNNIRMTYKADPSALDDRLTYLSDAGVTAITGFTGTPLVFDVTDPASPIRLEGGTFTDGVYTLSAPPNAHITAIGPAAPLPPFELTILRQGDDVFAMEGELVVIAAEALHSTIEPYIAHRTAQGLTVTVVDPQTIYDQFGFGLPTPDAIQAYLTDAHNNWSTPPRYVLLIGPARYDFRDYLGLLPENSIPSMMVPVTHSGETVSDNRIADVDGDFLPDLAIGRWPVGTVEEVSDLVERTIAYENGSAANRTLFAADGTSVEFTGLADHLVNTSEIPNTLKLYGASAAEVSESWNNGSWLVSYVGHGSIHLWGQDSLFSEESVDLLTRNDQFSPPIVAQFTCLSGYYAHPTERSLSEQLLSKDGGPVLVLGATSLTYSTHQRPFAEQFLAGLNDPTFERIGDVLLHARAGLDLQNEGIREVSDTFGLLGDPSAIIVRPSG